MVVPGHNAFSHILITRPREEGVELGRLLVSHPARVVILPAHEFRPCTLSPDQLALLGEAGRSGTDPLVVFTSPRSVQHGLAALPAELARRCRAGAVGPTTASLLREAGVPVTLQAAEGHTSEDLLKLIPALEPGTPDSARRAFIVCAPGGRTALADGLRDRGYRVQLLLVYERRTAELDPAAVDALREAERILSVWTSAEAAHSLAQRLPGECWKRVCAGEWLVISERLARIARSFLPAAVHRAAGPSNADLAAAIRTLVWPPGAGEGRIR